VVEERIRSQRLRALDGIPSTSPSCKFRRAPPAGASRVYSCSGQSRLAGLRRPVVLGRRLGLDPSLLIKGDDWHALRRVDLQAADLGKALLMRVAQSLPCVPPGVCTNGLAATPNLVDGRDKSGAPSSDLEPGWNVVQWRIAGGRSSPLRTLGIEITNPSGCKGPLLLDDVWERFAAVERAAPA
jgi:hypothetical protein